VPFARLCRLRRGNNHGAGRRADPVQDRSMALPSVMRRHRRGGADRRTDEAQVASLSTARMKESRTGLRAGLFVVFNAGNNRRIDFREVEGVDVRGACGSAASPVFLVCASGRRLVRARSRYGELPPALRPSARQPGYARSRRQGLLTHGCAGEARESPRRASMLTVMHLIAGSMAKALRSAVPICGKATRRVRAAGRSSDRLDLDGPVPASPPPLAPDRSQALKEPFLSIRVGWIPKGLGLARFLYGYNKVVRRLAGATRTGQIETRQFAVHGFDCAFALRELASAIYRRPHRLTGRTYLGECDARRASTFRKKKNKKNQTHLLPGRGCKRQPIRRRDPSSSTSVVRSRPPPFRRGGAAYAWPIRRP